MADADAPKARMQMRDGILPKFPDRRLNTAAAKKLPVEGPGIRHVYRVTTVVLAAVAFRAADERLQRSKRVQHSFACRPNNATRTEHPLLPGCFRHSALDTLRATWIRSVP